MFVLGGVGVGTALNFNERSFINDRNYPGGPGAYHFQQMTLPSNVVGIGCYMVNKWFQDLFLVSVLT